MNTTVLAVMFAGMAFGAGCGVLLIYLLWDEHRWSEFVEKVEGVFDNPLTRPLFRTTLGRWINQRTVMGYIIGGKYQKAADLAVREELVDETLDLLEERGRIREAGRLARRMARDERADRNYRQFIDLCVEGSRPVLAAEAAEEAGFWDEAINLMRRFESRNTRIRAARLAAEHDLPELAVEIFLKEEALMDAMRVAEENDMLDFVLAFCLRSPNPVLHHFGADAARRAGNPELGVRILLEHGYIHQAAQLARSAGLHDKADELVEELRRRRAERSRESLSAGGGPFGFDFSDEILEEDPSP
jgi:hypothetical protein